MSVGTVIAESTVFPWIEPVEPRDVSAADLREVAIEHPTRVECYRLQEPDSPEVGWAIFIPKDGRGAVAWGADGEWTDACCIEEVVGRWAAGERVE